MGGKCRQRKHKQRRAQKAECPSQPLHSRPARLQPGAEGLYPEVGAAVGLYPLGGRVPDQLVQRQLKEVAEQHQPLKVRIGLAGIT